MKLRRILSGMLAVMTVVSVCMASLDIYATADEDILEYDSSAITDEEETEAVFEDENGEETEIVEDELQSAITSDNTNLSDGQVPYIPDYEVEYEDSGIYFDESMLSSSSQENEPTPEILGLNIYHNGIAVADIMLARGEKLLLSAGSDTYYVDNYCWQILIKEKWQDISLGESADFELSYAMVATALNDESTAYIRCLSYSDGENLVSEPVAITVYIPIAEAPELEASIPDVIPTETITVEYSVTSSDGTEQEADYGIAPASMATFALGLEDEESVPQTDPILPNINILYISVNYMFGKDSNNPGIENVTAAESWVATIAQGSNLDTRLTIPTIVGYEPVIRIDEYADPNIKIRQSGYDLDMTYQNVQQDVNVVIEYFPSKYNKFEVHHYLQNVDNDEYVLDEIQIIRGHDATDTEEALYVYTNAPVNNYAKFDGYTYTLAYYHAGFYPLAYDGNVKIAADGSTVVEIYYDRYYYLMDFEIGLNAYGVEPQYGRYGTELIIDTPYRAGYDFGGWTLYDPILTDDNSEIKDGIDDNIELMDRAWQASPPNTMPKFNLTYEASWIEHEDTSIYIVIWEWNPNVNNGVGRYAYKDSTNIAYKTGQPYTYTPYHVHTTGANGCGCQMLEHTHDISCRSRIGNKASEHLIYGGYDHIEYSGQLVNGRIGTYKPFLGSRQYYIYYIPDGETTGAWYTYSADNISLEEIIDIEALSMDCQLTEHTHNSICTCQRVEMDPNLYILDESASNLTIDYVLANGESSVNVFYKRKEFTVTFRKLDTSDDSGILATITAPWGKVIRSEFEEVSKKNTYWWSQSIDGGGPWTSFLDTMPAENRTYYADAQSGTNTSTARYWGQKLGRPQTPYTEENYEILYTASLEGIDVNVTEEEYVKIEGFDIIPYDADGSPTADIGDDYNNANFYYTRSQYTLEFHSEEDLVKSVSMQYKQSLAEFVSYVPDNHIKFEAGSHVFGGWFLSPDCTGDPFDLNTKQMPANNLVLYAKWTPKLYRIELYRSMNDMEAKNIMTDKDGNLLAGFASYHSYIDWLPTEDEVRGEEEIYQQLSFRGWFYHNAEHHNEHYFNSSIPIIIGMSTHEEGNINQPLYWDDPSTEEVEQYEVIKIYGKWTSDILREYEVRYVLIESDEQTGEPILDEKGNTIPVLDGDGNQIVVAPSDYGSALGGTSKTFDAKVQTELYVDYRAGYYPLVPSHTMTLNAWSDELNLYTFEYVKATPPIPYTVRYLDAISRTPLKDEITYETNLAIVTEQFIAIDGYIPDAFQKRLVISATPANNIIEFYYTKNETNAPVQITYMVESLTEGVYTVYKEEFFTGDINIFYDVTADHIAPNDASTPSYKLNINGFTALDTVPDGQIGVTSGTLTKDGLHLYQYYSRNSYPYVFHYKVYNEENYPLLTSTTGTAKYMQEVKMEAPYIPGFKYAMDSASLSMTIRIEENLENLQFNERVFYYDPLQVMLDYDIVGPDNCATVSVHFQNVRSAPERLNSEGAGPTEGDIHADVIPCYPNYDPEKYNFLGWYVKILDEDGNLVEWVKLTEENAAQYNAKLGKATNIQGNEVESLQPQRTAYYHDTNNDGVGDTLYGYYYPHDYIFYVLFEARETTMTITRTTVAPSDYDQSFIYHIKGTDENTSAIDLTAVVPVLSGATRGSVIINEVPIGKYTVTEVTDWAWRYVPYEAEKAVTTEAGVILNLTYGEGTRKSPWLDGNAYVKNKFGSLTNP